MSVVTNTSETLAEIAYNAYCEAVDWESFNGAALPSWAHQSAKLQDAWQAAAEAVAEHLHAERGEETE